MHVTRVPCAGRWFEVPSLVAGFGSGVHTTFQMLDLDAALNRVRSGHVEVRQTVARPIKATCPVCRDEVRVANVLRSLEYCTPCQMEMCSACQVQCTERHELDPTYRRELSPEQLVEFDDGMRHACQVLAELEPWAWFTTRGRKPPAARGARSR